MSIQSLNPYLNFDGTAERAIQLYERALGATVEALQRFSDGPGGCGQLEPQHRGRIMHARLRIGGGVIMISDTMPGEAPVAGSNHYVCLQLTEPEEAARRFDALAQGGQVTMPLQDMFWGAKFGTLTDAFGVSWMFNCESQKG